MSIISQGLILPYITFLNINLTTWRMFILYFENSTFGVVMCWVGSGKWTREHLWKCYWSGCWTKNRRLWSDKEKRMQKIEAVNTGRRCSPARNTNDDDLSTYWNIIGLEADRERDRSWYEIVAERKDVYKVLPLVIKRRSPPSSVAECAGLFTVCEMIVVWVNSVYRLLIGCFELLAEKCRN